MILKGIRVLISIFCLVLICFWVASVIGPSMSVVIDVWRGNVKAYPNEHNNIPEIIVNSGGLIAHAGGGINGLKYTNSLEAMEQSIEHGFKMIELDLLISSDRRIVAVHDWNRFHVLAWRYCQQQGGGIGHEFADIPRLHLFAGGAGRLSLDRLFDYRVNRKR